MSSNLRIALGLLLGLGLGALCRIAGLPLPAPPVISGAALVVAMTLGYLGADRLISREARHRDLCGGPDGRTRGDGP